MFSKRKSLLGPTGINSKAKCENLSETIYYLIFRNQRQQNSEFIVDLKWIQFWGRFCANHILTNCLFNRWKWQWSPINVCNMKGIIVGMPFYEKNSKCSYSSSKLMIYPTPFEFSKFLVLYGICTSPLHQQYGNFNARYRKMMSNMLNIKNKKWIKTINKYLEWRFTPRS